MDLDLSDDQVALRDGIRSVLTGRFDIDRVRAGFDRAMYDELGEAGVFSLISDGFCWADAAIVFEQLGEFCIPGPLVASLLTGCVATIVAPTDNVVEHLTSVDTVVLLGEDVRRIDASTLSGRESDWPLDPLTPVFEMQSGWSHAAVVDVSLNAHELHQRGAVLSAAFALGIVYVIHRWQEKRRRQKERERAEAEEIRKAANPGRYKPDDHVRIVVEPLPVRWRLLYGYSLVGVLSHLLLDFTNSYGLRPFAPFNWHWYSWDIVSIIEFAILIPLVLALAGPWFFGLMGSELGAKRQRFPGRPSAIAALVCIVLVWWARDYNHRRAVTLLKNDVYSGQEPVRVFAGPYTLNPFKWLGVVETGTFYQSMIVDTLHDEVDPQKNAVTRYKPEETPLSLAAKRSKLGKYYLDWSKFPQTEVEMVSDSEGGGAIVHIHDLRFVYPDSKTNLLGIAVTVDYKGNVLEQVMGDRMERCNDPSCQ